MHKKKSLNHNLILISLVCLLGISTSISAKMYKWIDAEGNTHYTQSPPPDGIEGESIKPPTRVDTESAVKALDKQKQATDKLREGRITAKEEKQKAEEDALAQLQECEQAKKRLASYQRPRVNIINEDGSQRTIPEEERQAEIKKSQAYVDKACN